MQPNDLFFFKGEVISKADFAERLMQRMRELDAQVVVRVDAAEFAVRVGVGAGASTLYLESLYKDYLHASQEGRDAVLFHQATVATSPLVSLPQAGYETSVRAHLRPIIRGRAYGAVASHASLSSDIWGTGGDLPSRPLGRDRAIYLAFDREHALHQVSAHALEVWGIDFDHALSDALANLRAETRPEWELMEGGFFRAMWRDSYGCSRLLLADMFVGFPFSGRPVAVMAAREDLFVADEHNSAAQLAMLEHARARLRENNRWSGGSLLVLEKDGTWHPFEPVDPVVRQAEVSLCNIVRHREYDNQKKAMDQFQAGSQEKTFWIEPFLAKETADGQVFSACTYCQASGEALLPEVERLIFLQCGPDGKLMQSPLSVVPWDVARTIVGPLMSAVNTYPPRYLVKEFPDAEMRERLRAASIFPAHLAAR